MKRLLIILIVLLFAVSSVAADSKGLKLQTSFDTLTSWGTVGLMTSTKEGSSVQNPAFADFTDDNLVSAIADYKKTDKIVLEASKVDNKWIATATVYMYYYYVGSSESSMKIKVRALESLTYSSETIPFSVIPEPVDGKWDGGKFDPKTSSSDTQTVATATAANSGKIRAKGLCKLTIKTDDLSGYSISSTKKTYTGKLQVLIVT